MPASPGTTRRRRQRTPTSCDSAAAADPLHGSWSGRRNTGQASSMTQQVFFFGGGKAEGTKDMKAVLGGKGANLAEMTNLGVPVPPGFTIACSVCVAYLRDGKAPEELRAEFDA